MILPFTCLNYRQSYNITGVGPYQLVTVTITATNGGETSRDSNVMMNWTSEAGIVVGNLWADSWLHVVDRLNGMFGLLTLA